MPIHRRHILGLFGAALWADTDSPLLARWRDVASGADGVLGAAALHLGTRQMVSLRGDEHFPLASVCKLPAALHILALVDAGKLSRSESIEVIPADVSPQVSEVAARWPKQKSFPLDELLLLMIAKSDNTAVETLYRIGGGATAITARMRGWGIQGIRIDRTERQCGIDASGRTPAAHAAAMRRFIADPRDTGTPDATVHLLERLFRGELLSPVSTQRLIHIMEATVTGPARIKGLLPPGATVAHKTGTTGSAGTLNGSTNDVGVVTYPNRAAQFALAVYLKSSRRDLAVREKTIARIAQATYDFWSKS